MPAFLSSSPASAPPLVLRRGKSQHWRGNSEGDGGASGASLRTGRRVCVAFLAQSLGSFTSSPLLRKARLRGEAAAGGTARRRRRVQLCRWAPLPGGCRAYSRGGGGEAGRTLESPACGHSPRSRLGSALQHLLGVTSWPLPLTPSRTSSGG